MLITNGMRNGCNPSGHLSQCLLENCQVSKLFFFQAHKNKAKTSVRCGRSHLKRTKKNLSASAATRYVSTQCGVSKELLETTRESTSLTPERQQLETTLVLLSLLLPRKLTYPLRKMMLGQLFSF